MIGWHGGGIGGVGWFGIGLFWLVLVGLVVWLVVRLLPADVPRRAGAPWGAEARPAAPPTGAGPQADAVAGPALAILDQRLARGEVEIETYRVLRATLLEGRGGDAR